MARLLLADDDANVRSVLRRMLERDGHEVRVARDGFEASKMFRESPADVMILDLYMPGQEGLETLLELRAEFPDTRVIVISGGGARSNSNPCERLSGSEPCRC